MMPRVDSISPRAWNRPIKGILVTFSGGITAPNDLLGKDNGLAQLAGSMKQLGHRVIIRDFNTTRILSKLAPDSISQQLDEVFSNINCILQHRQNPLSLFLFSKLKQIESELSDKFVSVCDDIADELSNTIRRENIDFVGFKLWMGSGLLGSAIIAQKLKIRFPHLKIFGGGPQATIFQKYLYEFESVDLKRIFDAFVVGEGITTLPMLADWMRGKVSLDEIPNLVYFDKTAAKTFVTKREFASVSQIPQPDYSQETYPIGNNEKINFLVVSGLQLGCAIGCSFCDHPLTFGKNPRFRDADEMAVETTNSLSQLKTNAIVFGDSSPNPLRVLGLLNGLKRQNIETNSIMFGVIGHYLKNQNLLTLLAQSGVRAIFFGLEDLDDLNYKRLGKTGSSQGALDVVSWAAKAGISPVASFIYPNSFSSVESRDHTLSQVRGLPLAGAVVQPLILIPHTPMFEDPEKFNIQFLRSRDDYVNWAMRFHIKYLYPAALQSFLPIKVAGLEWHKMLGETGVFKRGLMSQNIPGLPHDIMLMAYYHPDFSLERESLLALEGMLRRIFFTKDADRINDFVMRVNEGVKKTCSKNEIFLFFSRIIMERKS